MTPSLGGRSLCEEVRQLNNAAVQCLAQQAGEVAPNDLHHRPRGPATDVAASLRGALRRLSVLHRALAGEDIDRYDKLRACLKWKAVVYFNLALHYVAADDLQQALDHARAACVAALEAAHRLSDMERGERSAQGASVVWQASPSLDAVDGVDACSSWTITDSLAQMLSSGSMQATTQLLLLQETALLVLALYLRQETSATAGTSHARRWWITAVHPLEQLLRACQRHPQTSAKHVMAIQEQLARTRVLHHVRQSREGTFDAHDADDTSTDPRVRYSHGVMAYLRGDRSTAREHLQPLVRSYRSTDCERLMRYTDEQAVPSEAWPSLTGDAADSGAWWWYVARKYLQQQEFTAALAVLRHAYVSAIAAADDIASLPFWSPVAYLQPSHSAPTPSATTAHTRRLAYGTDTERGRGVLPWHALAPADQRLLLGAAIAEALAWRSAWDACLQVCQRLRRQAGAPDTRHASADTLCQEAQWQVRLLEAEALARTHFTEPARDALDQLIVQLPHARLTPEASTLAILRCTALQMQLQLQAETTAGLQESLERMHRQRQRCIASNDALRSLLEAHLLNAEALQQLLQGCAAVDREVLPRLERAARLVPHQHDIGYNLALLYWTRLGQVSAAVRCWLACRRLHPDASDGACDRRLQQRTEAARPVDGAPLRAMDVACIRRRREEIAEMRLLEQIALADAATWE